MRKRLSATHQILAAAEKITANENTAFNNLAKTPGLRAEPCSGASFAHASLAASPGRSEHTEFQTPTLAEMRRISGEEIEINTEEDMKTRMKGRLNLNKIMVGKLSNDSILELNTVEGIAHTPNSFKLSPEHQLPELHL